MSATAKRMRGLAVHRAILIGNTATPLTEAERLSAPPDHTHKWTVAVRSAASHPLPTISEADQLGLSNTITGGAGAGDASGADNGQTGAGEGSSSREGASSSASGMNTRGKGHETDYHKMVGGKDDISHFIKRVQFKLHETYPQSVRNIDKPPFQVTETGWGEFDIQIRIFFVPESGEKPISTFHRLKLHPWHPIAVHAPEQQAVAPTTAEAGVGAANVAAGSTSSPAVGADTKADETIEASGAEADTTVADGDISMVSEDLSHAPAGGISIPEKLDDLTTPLVHETRSASAAALPAAAARVMPAVVHSWSYDEIVFPEPTEAFYEALISNIPTPLPTQSAQAFADPGAYRRYKMALSNLDLSSGPGGRDIHTESGLRPPHPLHDASGALFDGLSHEAVVAEAERLDKARHNAVSELEETRINLIEGERRLREGRMRPTVT